MKGSPEKYQGIFKSNKVKFQYKLRHGKVSPSNKDKNKEILEDLAQDIIKVKNNASSPPKALLKHSESIRSVASIESKTSRLSVSGINAKILRELFDNPFEVIFVEDGKNISLPSTKSVKVDVSKFIKKYEAKEIKMSEEDQLEFN